jgi:hypothetical protein
MAADKPDLEESAGMLIAQLSDPHFVPKDVRLFGKLDTARYLERAVEHLNAMRPMPARRKAQPVDSRMCMPAPLQFDQV